MSSTTMLECKKICMFRCLTAVALSIGMQFLLLAVFLLFINFHIFHPVEWIAVTVQLMLSFYTWLSIMPLISAIIIYGIILGKSHLAVNKYYASRLTWLLGTMLRKLTFLVIHVVVGFLTAWLYARFLHADYRNFLVDCYGSKCVNSRYTFLILIGIAAAVFHFVKELLRQEPEVEFPIIQEVKLVKIRSLLYATLYQSLLNSFVPTMAFACAYWLMGDLANLRCAHILNVEVDEALDSFLQIALNVRLLFYSWILTSQILCNMQLMQSFFSVMLATELQFVIEKNPVLVTAEAEVSLIDALSLTQVPVIQKLAALDLYNISINKTSTKRLEIYSLSVPGGHPYNWHQLSSQCLSLINAFTAELSSSVKNISAMKSTPLFATVKPSATDAAEKILLRQYNETFGIRRMMAEEAHLTSTTANNCSKKNVSNKTPNACQRINEAFEQFSRQLEESCRMAFRTIPGLYYMFGEQDGAKTIFLLSNSQTIVWLTQGLAGICAASLVEDRYGVVQNELPLIIKALLNLKMELDKLNNVNLNGTKLDRNLITLKSAVKRSLYKICTVFGEYMHDLISDPEDLRSLQGFLNFQET